MEHAKPHVLVPVRHPKPPVVKQVIRQLLGVLTAPMIALRWVIVRCYLTLTDGGRWYTYWVGVVGYKAVVL